MRESKRQEAKDISEVNEIPITVAQFLIVQKQRTYTYILTNNT